MDIQCNNCQSYLNIREVVTRCTECKELIFKTKTYNMKNNFKDGDTVYHYEHGKGTFSQDPNTMEYVVQFVNGYCTEPALIGTGIYEMLSFTEYKLEGFTQKRPFEPKIGEKYFFWNDETIKDDCVGYGKLKQISNNINFPYFFGTKYFQFCSDKNPLL